jgi:nucleobase:cation symporter-1, NCS1 family
LLRKKEINVEQLYIKEGKYWYKHGFNFKAIIAFVCGVAPCVPGFLNKINLIKTTDFFINLYDYSWFIGFIISFVIYSILSIGENGE